MTAIGLFRLFGRRRKRKKRLFRYLPGIPSSKLDGADTRRDSGLRPEVSVPRSMTPRFASAPALRTERRKAPVPETSSVPVSRPQIQRQSGRELPGNMPEEKPGKASQPVFWYRPGGPRREESAPPSPQQQKRAAQPGKPAAPGQENQAPECGRPSPNRQNQTVQAPLSIRAQVDRLYRELERRLAAELGGLEPRQ